MPNSTDKALAPPSTAELLRLCAGVLPVWSRQLAASRSQSEKAVSEMMEAFASIGPHLDRAQQQSQQIDAALDHPDGPFNGLEQACQAALAPLLQAPGLPAGGAEAIASVLERVRQAVASIETLALPVSRETSVVAEHVEHMYIGFQYQDRISQMIALLETDISRLQDALGGHSTDPPDLDFWLERLEDQYAMEEQRHSHSGAANSGDDDGGKETTFF